MRRAGKVEGVRQQPEARRPACELDAIRFAARCISPLDYYKPDREVRLFLCPPFRPSFNDVQDDPSTMFRVNGTRRRNHPVQWPVSLDLSLSEGRAARHRPGGAVSPPLRCRLRRPTRPALFSRQNKTVIPARPYRHSRVSGNPERYGQRAAYCQAVFLDSRLRGNDSGEWAIRIANEKNLVHPVYPC